MRSVSILLVCSLLVACCILLPEVHLNFSLLLAWTTTTSNSVTYVFAFQHRSQHVKVFFPVLIYSPYIRYTCFLFIPLLFSLSHSLQKINGQLLLRKYSSSTTNRCAEKQQQIILQEELICFLCNKKRQQQQICCRKNRLQFFLHPSSQRSNC